jgi:hypothetical protein
MSSFVNARGLYLLLVRTPIYYLYCATLFFLACVLSSWWFFVYMPSMRSVDNLYRALDEMHQKTLMVKKTEHELAALTQSISELKISMADYAAKQPRKDILQHMLALVVQTALQNGMRVNLCKLSEQINATSGFNQILFAGKGTLDQLIVFFEALKNSKKIFDCSSCEMVRAEYDTYTMKVVLNVLYV